VKLLRYASAFALMILPFIVVTLLWWQGVIVADLAYRQWAAHVQLGQTTPAASVPLATPGSDLSFAETYGAVSALFAGLAFAAVAWNLIRQQREITHGRIREQFFQLLNAWQSATRDIRYNCKQGNEALLRAENDLLGAYAGVTGTFSQTGQFFGKHRAQAHGAYSIGKIVKVYKEFYEKRIGGSLAYIFRVQYQILKTVHGSALPKRMRGELADVYRSMLSDPELHLLLYFSLSSYAAKDYADLISQYRILDSLLYKEERFIADRIPEIQHFRLYRNWRDRRQELIQGTIPP